MNNTGVIDQFLNVFTQYIDSGFGLVGGDVRWLSTTLIAIDMTLAGLFWAMAGEEDILARLIKKTLYVGFFAFVIGNFNSLCKVVYQSFSGLGLEASGSTLSAQTLLQPGKLAQVGIDAGKPILAAASSLTGYVSIVTNAIPIFVLLVAWVVVVLSFFVLAIQLFIVLLEFKLTTLAGFVLIPFALFNKTAFLAEKVLGNVVASGVKILVLAVIVGIGSTLFSQFTQGFGSNQPTIEDALSIMLGALALFGLGVFGPANRDRSRIRRAAARRRRRRRHRAHGWRSWCSGCPRCGRGHRRSRLGPRRRSTRRVAAFRFGRVGRPGDGSGFCVACRSPRLGAAPTAWWASRRPGRAPCRAFGRSQWFELSFSRSGGAPMNPFRRPSVRYGKTPAPETPYQKAAQVWDERIGSARVQARNWRLIAFGNLALAGGLAAALVWQATRGTIVPWVVQVDKLGEAQVVAPAIADYRPSDAQIAWYLAQFIEQVRSVGVDPIILRQNWLKAYDFVTDRGALALNDYARTNDPFAKIGKAQVAVDVSSVIRASPDLFRIAWVERRYENDALAATERWTAIVTVAIATPVCTENLSSGVVVVKSAKDGV